mmetsp:Transcript_20402/g.56417  ORF Transcript_20402/g.56417 Transcript_20402/m.56417 type:complete len:107 (+) Transcript_20402:201-521(+)|eukprot:CAMPEP_0113681008 /NCGR_PEP_ID=MMETSP0038_2-20120614/11701_1 /TAXON_ID=2898 /ORGANISM="Cryptomonas paramecium" /LENGTH=106 /DNA_ID=CAMNT_0000599583 /DNA_START=145 /DNA_END=465 /DNA_ORIENTATION=+ /assembly_acc=CAM_ASM_000170
MLYLVPLSMAPGFGGMGGMQAGMPGMMPAMGSGGLPGFGMLRNDPYSMRDTTASGNWYKADEPWGAYLQTDGHPARNLSNPQAQTTWVPIDNGSWPNYNVHGYGIY